MTTLERRDRVARLEGRVTISFTIPTDYDSLQTSLES
jgi:hypothetical protein